MKRFVTLVLGVAAVTALAAPAYADCVGTAATFDCSTTARYIKVGGHCDPEDCLICVYPVRVCPIPD